MNHRIGARIRGLPLARLAVGALGCATMSSDAARVELAVVSGDHQRALAGDTVPSLLEIQALSASRGPAQGLRVDFEVEGGGAVVAVGSVTDELGVIRARWRLGGAGPQRAIARLSDDRATPVSFQAEAVDSALADVIAVASTAAGALTEIIAYDAEGFNDFDRLELTDTDPARTIVPYLHPDRRDGLIAFSDGRAPGRLDPHWSGGPDTARLATAEPIALPISVWIVKPPYALYAARAKQDLAAARTVWLRMGIDIQWTDAEVIDATGFPNAAQLLEPVAPCAPAPGWIGVRPDRINVYYIGGIVGFNGFSCGGFVLLASDQSRGGLVAHELGHELGLGHESESTNVMAPVAGTVLADGQGFRAHFHIRSALNTMFHAHPPLLQLDCDQPTGGGTLGGRVITRCPPTTLQSRDR